MQSKQFHVLVTCPIAARHIPKTNSQPTFLRCRDAEVPVYLYGSKCGVGREHIRS